MARRIWLLVAAVAALALATGTGGFSTAQMDRSMTVNVASPENAYVGLYDPGANAAPEWASDYTNGSVTADGDVPLLVVHNQFDDRSLEVTVTLEDGAEVSDLGPYEFDLHSGDKRVIHADTTCEGEDTSASVDLRITANSMEESMHATITHTVEIPCA
jgi:hypothetical protein